MANLTGFDANEHEPTSFEVLPANKYLAIIEESENKPTKAKNGHYLEIKFQIIEGEHKGRNLWENLNIDNPNPKAVQVAMGELSAICRAVGVMKPKDSVELHNLPLLLTVACKKRADTGEMENVIKKYEPPAAAQGEPQQAPTDAPPWLRK